MFNLTKLSFEFDKRNAELISDFLSGVGAIGVAEDFIDETKSEINSYYPNFTNMNEVIYKIKNYVSVLEAEYGKLHLGQFEVEEIDETKWQVWRDILKAVRVTDCIVIRPPWEGYSAKDNEIVIEINPSMAFGTGHHESTRLCLEAAEKIIANEKTNSVLDVGCGSGILSIACYKLGVEKIVAFDVDPVSIDETLQNMERNGLSGKFETKCCEIKDIDGRFDLILANVYAEPLIGMSKEMKSRLNKDGRIVLSGFQDFRLKEITQAYEESGFRLEDILQDDEWVCTVFQI
ncbi:MAG: 50S ribosomal protein L11 methyltransferase [Candidatus Dadabacteria bacterium]|nr:50S ribosomal protein L11 methyltransferase [Candidatus Dadabacteria bacterium]NIS10061.1 50S ribosomal protein L11 methyltransferase [Candidatus Dadabacteria bacterium]NIV42138.1 50S ribosomal protein L11 methyltransferase [Candidatus Dadabacteria bacterium]NIX16447.1 50S ribosomal protein L11 methyltransferase [Candidatus Dadabacteria bacterium]NIY23008.1 50S ribosomal protein L11 methyltransferase [Candidatus Dadabacteria bacterium]